MRIYDIIDEKFIPSVKPIDYNIQVEHDMISTSIKIGSKLVNIEFNIGPSSSSKDFLRLIKPESSIDNRALRAGDLAFQVGDDEESMTDQKNTGEPIKEAVKIGKAVSYIANDIVYRHRSKLPFITFWARPGENRDNLYEKISQEFTESWKNWNYVRLDPAAVFGRPLHTSFWMWGHKSAFVSWTADQEKIQRYLAVPKL